MCAHHAYILIEISVRVLDVAQFVLCEGLAGEIGGTRLNVPELMAEAAKIMPSLLDEYAWNTGYKALDVMKPDYLLYWA